MAERREEGAPGREASVTKGGRRRLRKLEQRRGEAWRRGRRVWRAGSWPAPRFDRWGRREMATSSAASSEIPLAVIWLTTSALLSSRTWMLQCYIMKHLIDGTRSSLAMPMPSAFLHLLYSRWCGHCHAVCVDTRQCLWKVKGQVLDAFFVIKGVQSWNSTNGLFVAITIKDFSRVEIPTSLFVDDWIDWRLPRMKLIYWCCIRQFEKGGFIWASTRVLKAQQSVKNHRYCSGIIIYQLSLRSSVFSFNELCVQNKTKASYIFPL